MVVYVLRVGVRVCIIRYYNCTQMRGTKKTPPSRVPTNHHSTVYRSHLCRTQRILLLTSRRTDDWERARERFGRARPVQHRKVVAPRLLFDNDNSRSSMLGRSSENFCSVFVRLAQRSAGSSRMRRQGNGGQRPRRLCSSSSPVLCAHRGWVLKL